MHSYEGMTCFDFMGLDRWRSGEATFRELWRENVEWFEHVNADVQSIPTAGCFEDEE